MPQPREPRDFAPPGKLTMVGTPWRSTTRNFFQEALERPIDSFHEALRASAERDDPPDWPAKTSRQQDVSPAASTADDILADGGLSL